jgi:hypothetical protein
MCGSGRGYCCHALTGAPAPDSASASRAGPVRRATSLAKAPLGRCAAATASVGPLMGAAHATRDGGHWPLRWRAARRAPGQQARTVADNIGATIV